MDENTIGQHQEMLHDLLRDSALYKNSLLLENKDSCTYINRLHTIYTEGFHHQYSKLFEVVNCVFQDDDKDVSVFQENLKALRMFIAETKEDDLLKIFDKLRDHLSLEISRREILREQENKMTELQKDYSILENKAEHLKEKIDMFSDRLSKIQTDFVAILAIFAAVVIAFSSGSNYILSALSTVSKTFTFEVVFIILLCGLILMDTLFMLFYFISSIIERHIGVRWWLAVLVNIVVIFALFWIADF